VGFVPCLALQKALRLNSVRAIPLENGPIVRQLSIALLNGPDLKGPAGQLLDILRESGAARWRTKSSVKGGLERRIGAPNSKVNCKAVEIARKQHLRKRTNPAHASGDSIGR
jgi:hypothetical protein